MNPLVLKCIKLGEALETQQAALIDLRDSLQEFLNVIDPHTEHEPIGEYNEDDHMEGIEGERE